MELKITQSNKKAYIGRGFIYHARKDLIIIGTKVLGMGQKYEIPCKDVKDFKILDVSISKSYFCEKLKSIELCSYQ